MNRYHPRKIESSAKKSALGIKHLHRNEPVFQITKTTRNIPKRDAKNSAKEHGNTHENVGIYGNKNIVFII